MRKLKKPFTKNGVIVNISEYPSIKDVDYEISFLSDNRGCVPKKLIYSCNTKLGELKIQENNLDVFKFMVGTDLYSFLKDNGIVLNMCTEFYHYNKKTKLNTLKKYLDRKKELEQYQNAGYSFVNQLDRLFYAADCIMGKKYWEEKLNKLRYAQKCKEEHNEIRHLTSSSMWNQ